MSSKIKKLGTLADIYQTEHLDGTITTLRLSKIHPSEDQPRQDRTLAVDELAASIQKDGLLSPIVVTRDGEGYRIIAGERRYHAVRKLGLQEVECRIISREERDYWRIAIVENLQRENLSAHEEASALLKLKKQESYSDAELATLVGKSRNYVTEILGIAELPDAVREQCRAAGIDNKNLLIQVVQAHKKNAVDAFLEAYRAGEIKTVRAAKEFNQGRAAGTADERGGEADKKSPAARTDADPANLSVETSGKNVYVTCASPGAARKLAKWIRANYKA